MKPNKRYINSAIRKAYTSARNTPAQYNGSPLIAFIKQNRIRYGSPRFTALMSTLDIVPLKDPDFPGLLVIMLDHNVTK